MGQLWGAGAEQTLLPRVPSLRFAPWPSEWHRAVEAHTRTSTRPQELLFIAQLQQKKNLNVAECTKVWVLKERGKQERERGEGNKTNRNKRMRYPNQQSCVLTPLLGSCCPGGSGCCCAQFWLRVGCNSAAVPWTAGQPGALCCTFFSSLHSKPKSSQREDQHRGARAGEQRCRPSDPLLCAPLRCPPAAALLQAITSAGFQPSYQTRGVSRAFPPPVCIHVVEEDDFPLKQLRRRPSLQRGMQTWLLELCLEAQQPGGQQGELLGAVPISDAKHSETLGVAMKNGAWPLLPGRCSLAFKLFSSRCTPLGNPLFPSVQGEASESTGKEGKALQERSASTASARELMC